MGGEKREDPMNNPPGLLLCLKVAKSQKVLQLFRFKQFEFWHSFFALLDDSVWQASLDGHRGSVDKGTSGWEEKGRPHELPLLLCLICRGDKISEGILND